MFAWPTRRIPFHSFQSLAYKSLPGIVLGYTTDKVSTPCVRTPFRTHRYSTDTRHVGAVLALLLARDRPLAATTAFDVAAGIDTFPSDGSTILHRHVAGVACFETGWAQVLGVVEGGELEGSSAGHTRDTRRRLGNAVGRAAELVAFFAFWKARGEYGIH